MEDAGVKTARKRISPEAETCSIFLEAFLLELVSSSLLNLQKFLRSDFFLVGGGLRLLFHIKLYSTVLRIHDILVWVRIRGSTPLTNGTGFGSGSDSSSRSCYFCQ